MGYIQATQQKNYEKGSEQETNKPNHYSTQTFAVWKGAHASTNSPTVSERSSDWSRYLTEKYSMSKFRASVANENEHIGEHYEMQAHSQANWVIINIASDLFDV